MCIVISFKRYLKAKWEKNTHLLTPVRIAAIENGLHLKLHNSSRCRQKMWFFLNKIRDNCDEIEILYAEIIYWARNAEWILNIEQWIWVFGVLCGIFGSVSNQHYMQSLSSMMLPSGGHNLRISSYRERANITFWLFLMTWTCLRAFNPFSIDLNYSKLLKSVRIFKWCLFFRIKTF